MQPPQALLQHLGAQWELVRGKPGGTDAHAAAATVADTGVAVVAREAAGEQEAVSKLTVGLRRDLVAIPLAEGGTLHSLCAEWCSKAASLLLAVTRVPIGMPSVHALGAAPVFPGPYVRLQSAQEEDAAQQALKEGEVHRQVVGEEFPLVVKEALRKHLVIREGCAGCLHAQKDHTSPAVPAAEAQTCVPAVGALTVRVGKPADNPTQLAGPHHTVRLHHMQPDRTETTSRRPRTA